MIPTDSETFLLMVISNSSLAGGDSVLGNVSRGELVQEDDAGDVSHSWSEEELPRKYFQIHA